MRISDWSSDVCSSDLLHHPYYIARAFATLDHLSKGRAGWNIVTSSFDQEAQSYGRDRLPDKNVRYDMADEAVEACFAHWNSWDVAALQVAHESGIFADPSKVHCESGGDHVRTSVTKPTRA